MIWRVMFTNGHSVARTLVYFSAGLVAVASAACSTTQPGNGEGDSGARDEGTVHAGGDASAGADRGGSAPVDAGSQATPDAEVAVDGAVLPDASTLPDASMPPSDNKKPDAASADAQTGQCASLDGACEWWGIGCGDYASTRAELAERCDPTFRFRRYYAGEGCGYLILAYVYGAGDTITAFYDPESGALMGMHSVSDTLTMECAGEVPTECLKYAGVVGKTADLCPIGDAGVQDGSTGDAEVGPDADGVAPDSGQDAGAL
jgi:hypothetical protein